VALEVVEPRHVVVHGFDTRSHCVYDLDGHPSQLSLGALLESMALAASSHGLRMEARRRADMPDTLPTFDVHFVDSPGLAPDPLAAFCPGAACSGAGSARAGLRASEKAALAASLPSGYRCNGSRAGARAGLRAPDVRQCPPAPDHARSAQGAPRRHRVGRATAPTASRTRRWAWTP
jgi:hypothetical protein